MASETQPIPDLQAWRSLFSPAHKTSAERALLGRQLERWSIAHGGVDAALYSRRATESNNREAHVGDVSFPLQMPSSTDCEENGWRCLELPSCTLVLRADGVSSQALGDPALLLIAAAVHIRGLKREIQEHSFQAKFRGVELEALYEVGLAIASTLDLDELVEAVLLRAVSLLDARQGALFLLEDDKYHLNRTIGGEALSTVALDDAALAALLAGEGEGPPGLIPGALYLLAVPVEIDGDPRGLLVVADKESRHGVGPFPTTDRRTLALFANQAAIALENAKLHRLALEKERLEREMELAAEIQKQLLPEIMPEIPGFEVHGWNRPARQVGGDYYGLLRLADGSWSLVVGDVTGKGLPAALLVSTLHSALRLLLDRMEIGPTLVERLNRHVLEMSGTNKFITMLVAQLDAQSGRLRYLNAGHNPGLLIRQDGRVEELGATGLPVGLMPHSTYELASLDLEPGDLLCLYSDGITECTAPDDEELGLDRLIALLSEAREIPLPEIISIIDQETRTFAGDLPQGDDQTVVLVRCTLPAS